MLVKIFYETWKGTRDYIVDLQYIPTQGTILQINPDDGSYRVIVQTIVYQVDESEFIKVVRKAKDIISGDLLSKPQIEIYAVEEHIFKKRKTFFRKLKAILFCEL